MSFTCTLEMEDKESYGMKKKWVNLRVTVAKQVLTYVDVDKGIDEDDEDEGTTIDLENCETEVLSSDAETDGKPFPLRITTQDADSYLFNAATESLRKAFLHICNLAKDNADWEIPGLKSEDEEASAVATDNGNSSSNDEESGVSCSDNHNEDDKNNNNNSNSSSSTIAAPPASEINSTIHNSSSNNKSNNSILTDSTCNNSSSQDEDVATATAGDAISSINNHIASSTATTTTTTTTNSTTTIHNISNAPEINSDNGASSIDNTGISSHCNAAEIESSVDKASEKAIPVDGTNVETIKDGAMVAEGGDVHGVHPDSVVVDVAHSTAHSELHIASSSTSPDKGESNNRDGEMDAVTSVDAVEDANIHEIIKEEMRKEKINQEKKELKRQRAAKNITRFFRRYIAMKQELTDISFLSPHALKIFADGYKSSSSHLTVLDPKTHLVVCGVSPPSSYLNRSRSSSLNLFSESTEQSALSTQLLSVDSTTSLDCSLDSPIAGHKPQKPVCTVRVNKAGRPIRDNGRFMPLAEARRLGWKSKKELLVSEPKPTLGPEWTLKSTFVMHDLKSCFGGLPISDNASEPESENSSVMDSSIKKFAIATDVTYESAVVLTLYREKSNGNEFLGQACINLRDLKGLYPKKSSKSEDSATHEAACKVSFGNYVYPIKNSDGVDIIDRSLLHSVFDGIVTEDSTHSLEPTTKDSDSLGGSAGGGSATPSQSLTSASLSAASGSAGPSSRVRTISNSLYGEMTLVLQIPPRSYTVFGPVTKLTENKLPGGVMSISFGGSFKRRYFLMIDEFLHYYGSANSLDAVKHSINLRDNLKMITEEDYKGTHTMKITHKDEHGKDAHWYVDWNFELYEDIYKGNKEEFIQYKQTWETALKRWEARASEKGEK